MKRVCFSGFSCYLFLIEFMCGQAKPSISLLVAVLKVRENAGDQVVIGFSFASDWFRVARVFWTNHRAK